MKRKRNVRTSGEKIKEAILGSDPADQRFFAYFYAIGTIFYILTLAVFIPLGKLAAERNNLSPVVSWVFLGCVYFGMLLLIRLLLSFVKGLREFYIGKNTDEIQGDDFSEIEALVLKGKYLEAINRYREEFREREGKDERPRMRIAEIYWFFMQDYRGALNQYSLIVRTTKDPAIELLGYMKLIELMRDKFPDDDRLMPACKYVIAQFPGTAGALLAMDCAQNKLHSQQSNQNPEVK